MSYSLTYLQLKQYQFGDAVDVERGVVGEGRLVLLVGVALVEGHLTARADDNHAAPSQMPCGLRLSP